jgi:hypothetical protein
LGGLPRRRTNHCIPGKDLIDDALPSATIGLNNHQRRKTDNIYLLGEFSEILTKLKNNDWGI